MFDQRELRRILHVLRTRKANSVCGDRDPVSVKRKRDKFGLKSGKIATSRRSLSIYSERVNSPKTNDGGKEPISVPEWRYRVKNRDHIPDFLNDANETNEIW